MEVWAICVKIKTCQSQSNFQRTDVLYPNPQSWGWLKINKSPQQIVSWIHDWTVSFTGGESGVSWEWWCPWRGVGAISTAVGAEYFHSLCSTEKLTFSMSHSIHFYPNLSVTWIDFCRRGTKTKDDGEVSCFLLHHLAVWLAKLCPWQGTSITQVCPPRTKTSLVGVCAWFTHLFPHTESPFHSWGVQRTSSQHGKLAHPRGTPCIAALWTTPAAPASGTGAESHKRGKHPLTYIPQRHHLHRLQSNWNNYHFFIYWGLGAWPKDFVRDKWRRVSREVEAQICFRFIQVNLEGPGMTVLCLGNNMEFFPVTLALSWNVAGSDGHRH